MKEKQIRPDMITVSAGIAAAPEHGCTAAELLHAADSAMYAAKQAGRDRVVAYQAMEPSWRALA
jgi:diguanylate cyclase (GGDEF)-like protein